MIFWMWFISWRSLCGSFRSNWLRSSVLIFWGLGYNSTTSGIIGLSRGKSATCNKGFKLSNQTVLDSWQLKFLMHRCQEVTMLAEKLRQAPAWQKTWVSLLVLGTRSPIKASTSWLWPAFRSATGAVFEKVSNIHRSWRQASHLLIELNSLWASERSS